MSENNRSDVESTLTGVYISKARLAWAVIAVLVSAFSIPFASNLYMSIASVAFCSVFLIASGKKKFLTGLLIFLLLGSFSLPTGLPAVAIILSLIVGTGAFAWLIFLTKSPYLAILPVLAYAATTIITKNWFASVACLVFSLPALVLALSLRNGTPRLETLTKTSVAFVSTAVVAVVASLLYFSGELRFDILKDIVTLLTDELTKAFASIEVQTLDGSIQTFFTPDDAYNMAHQLTSLLPAAIILGFNTITFFAQRLMFSIIRITMGDACIHPHSIPFVVGPGAGIVYTLSLTATLLTNASPVGYAINTVCQNLFIILAPPLAGMGILYLFSRIAAKKMRIGTLIILGVVALLFFSLPMVFMLLAGFGAYASVAIPLSAFLKARMKGEDR